MKIYGHFMSSPTNQVRLTASALSIDFDYEHIDIAKGEAKAPAYLAINPFGRVPALDDDGFILAESAAICRYLALKNETPLYPNDPKTRGVIDQWMDVSAHHVRTNVGKILFNKFLAKIMDVPVDEKSMADGEQFLNNNLPFVEGALKKSAFIAGDTLSIADPAMMASMEPLDMVGFDLSPFPTIVRWRQEQMQSEWYTKIHAHFAAEMKN